MSRMSDKHVEEMASERSNLLREASSLCDKPTLSIDRVIAWLSANLEFELNERRERLFIESKAVLTDLRDELMR